MKKDGFCQMLWKVDCVIKCKAFLSVCLPLSFSVSIFKSNFPISHTESYFLFLPESIFSFSLFLTPKHMSLIIYDSLSNHLNKTIYFTV